MGDYYQAILSACLAVILGIYAVRWYTSPVRPSPPVATPSQDLRSEYHPQLRVIPTVGGSDLPGLSYIGAMRMQGDCRATIEAGYKKACFTPSLSRGF